MNRRNRLVYAAVIGVVIVAGLGSRSEGAGHLPMFISAYAGDTLWALTVFLVLGFCFPAAATWAAAVAMIFISFGIELSQLYQADWINAIRDTRPGALVLGAGFKASDLICYSVGCLVGTVGEYLVVRSDTNLSAARSKAGA
jgi:hypothetical protein